MPKRKRNAPTIEEVLERPWCFYCERDFDDLKVLIAHQKAKHYKCEQCNRRLNTAGGLSVHMSQVHKETLTKIENALPGRGEIGVEIFGMHGIPNDILEAHKNRITAEYFKQVAERRAETGNPPPGSQSDNAVKKPKIETSEEIRKRLAEHKAKREAEKEAKARAENNSNNSTPFSGASPFTAPAAEINGHHTTQSPNVDEQPKFQSTPIQAGFPPGLPPQGMPPGFPSAMPPSMSPAAGAMFAGPPQGTPPFFAPPHNNGPPTMQSPSWSGPPGFAPPQFMPPRPHNSFASKQSNGNLVNQTNAKQPDLPKPPSSLPAVPGLPSRPAIDAPNFSRDDMARLHAGAQARQNFSPSTHAPSPLSASHEHAVLSTPTSYTPVQQGDHIDDLINSITNGKSEQVVSSETQALPATNWTQSVDVKVAPPPAASITHSPAPAESRSKSSKKSKSANKNTKLVYSDDKTSPEEKRAQASRYAFKRDESTQYVLGDVGPAVTGAVRGSDDVLDAQAAH